MSLITTYRHDYIDPRQMLLNYKLTNAANQSNMQQSKNECNCVPEDDTTARLAARLNEQCGATAADEGKSEWTGIAPMGLLIKARVIPADDQDQTENMDDCFVTKPNRYLQNLPNANPSLFEDLRQMNRDDLSKILDKDRLKTTYQIDYGGVAEYRMGTYGDNEMTEDQIRSGLQSGEPNDPCTDQNLLKEHRAPPKKCFRPIYRTKVCCKHCPAVRGHWQNESKTKGAEFAMSVNEVGALIMKERLNDHSKCNANKCKHTIMYSMFKDKM